MSVRKITVEEKVTFWQLKYQISMKFAATFKTNDKRCVMSKLQDSLFIKWLNMSFLKITPNLLQIVIFSIQFE